MKAKLFLKKVVQHFWLTGILLIITLALFAWTWMGLQNLLVVLHSLAR